MQHIVRRTETLYPVAAIPACNAAAMISPRMQRSLSMLKQESHELRVRIGEKELEGKGTAKSYPRQVQNYQLWFEADQERIAAEDSTRVPIPAFPVTVAKVAMFLHHETTREKVGSSLLLSEGCLLMSHTQYKQGGKSTIQGSSLGKSHVAQVINALEKYRLNHEHGYPRDHETRVSLRKDSRIRAFESASKHNEPKRVEKSQTIKAAGTSSGKHPAPPTCQHRKLTAIPLSRHLHQGGAHAMLSLVPH